MVVTYYVASSVDGFIAEEGGGVGFLDRVAVTPDWSSYEAFFASVDGLVMGRRTFDQALGFGPWPYGAKPCWVMTRRALVKGPEGAAAVEGPAARVAELARERGVKHLWVVGGAEIARQFLEEGLLTDMVVTVVPAVLGTGVPLLGRLKGERLLERREVTLRADGMVEIRYGVKR